MTSPSPGSPESAARVVPVARWATRMATLCPYGAQLPVGGGRNRARRVRRIEHHNVFSKESQ
jgi:hypothetical protein